MFTNVDDLLDFVDQRNRDLRREASAYRQAQAHRLSHVHGPTPRDRVRTLMARLRLVRPLPGRAEATT